MANTATNRGSAAESKGSRARTRNRRPPSRSEKEKKGLAESQNRASLSKRTNRKGQAPPGARPRKNQQNSRERQKHLIRMDNPDDLITRTTDYRRMKRQQRDPFVSTIQKSRVWLKEVVDEIGAPDELRSHLALKAVLQTLRDRLPVEEAVQLGAQLPELIRGMYFEGWVPAGKPIKYNRAEFVDAVRRYFLNLSGINHEDYIRGVFNVLRKHVSEGELNNVMDTLPKDLAELFGRQMVGR